MEQLWAIYILPQADAKPQPQHFPDLAHGQPPCRQI
jgi:hypothetical protein